jgi:hypothetical protein
VIERLNTVVPEDWSTEFEPYPGGKQIICKLTLFDVTRSDVGTQSAGKNVDPVKGGYSDALKRAAVHFGIGVSIYALRQVHRRDLPQNGTVDDSQGRGFTVTDEGMTWLRRGYRKWIEGPGKDAFGEPLDHGDVEDAVGDPEAAPTGALGEPVETPSLEDEALRAEVETLYERLTDAQRRKRPALGKARFNQQLAGAVSEGSEALTKLKAELEERAK